MLEINANLSLGKNEDNENTAPFLVMEKGKSQVEGRERR
jgi:hypothetical protein